MNPSDPPDTRLNVVGRPARELQPLPSPRVPIRIRVARQDDLAWIDTLQKSQTKNLGFLQRKALETYITRGDVLVAEEIHHGERGGHGEESGFEDSEGTSAQCLVPSAFPSNAPSVNSVSSVVNKPLGYIISRDTYFKRDDVGVIYQLCVDANAQRGLVGAALVREVFNRAAYGCKLFCCWCAQDISANYFWEAIGFTPLAFRTGSAKKTRIHIFWQKRIREGDVRTPWWFPSRTGSGMVREDRLVIPIPPGTRWQDAKPLVLPGVEQFQALEEGEAEVSSQESEVSSQESEVSDQESGVSGEGLTADPGPLTAEWWGEEGPPAFIVMRNGEVIRDPRDPRLTMPWSETAAQTAERERFEAALKEARLNPPKPKKVPRKVVKKKKAKSGKEGVAKYHPKYVEAARELCARFLDEVNREGSEYLLSSSMTGAAGKYDVARLEGEVVEVDDQREIARPVRLLEAA